MRRVADHALWLGNAGDLRDPRGIIGQGIEVVIELADSEPMALLPRELIRCRFPLSDGGDNPAWLLRLAADTVAANLRDSAPTLVCCSAGMSRSVVVAAAGLALSEGQSFVDMLARVAATGPADVSPRVAVEMRAVIDLEIRERGNYCHALGSTFADTAIPTPPAALSAPHVSRKRG